VSARGPTVRAECDVAIIGGGPAGSTAAAFLAKAGRHVVLFEKEHFPRYHIGESLLGAVPPILRLLGAEERVAARRFVRKYGGSFIWGKDRDKPWHWRFAEVPDNPLYSYHVRRAEFDQVLLENARDQGATVLEGYRATGLLKEDGRVTGVAYRDPERVERQIAARYVIIATGQESLALEREHRFQYNEDFKNIAVFSYFSPALPVPNWDPSEPCGNQLIVAFEEGWFWVIPQSEELTSVGAVVSSRSFGELQRMGKEAFFEAMVRKCPQVAQMLEGRQRVEPVRVIRDYSFAFERFCGPGYFRAGDAALFVDPLWSYGVTNAMKTATLAAFAINSLLGALPGAREPTLQHAYQDTLEWFYRTMVRQLLYFYNAHREMRSYFWKTHNLNYAIRQSSQRQTFIKVLSGGNYLIRDKLDEKLRAGEDIGEEVRAVFDRFTASGEPLRDDEWTHVATAEVFDALAKDAARPVLRADSRPKANYDLSSYLYVDTDRFIAQAAQGIYHHNAFLQLSSVAARVLAEADGSKRAPELAAKVARDLRVTPSAVLDALHELARLGALREHG
jgi:halogenation protein CepH